MVTYTCDLCGKEIHENDMFYRIDASLKMLTRQGAKLRVADAELYRDGDSMDYSMDVCRDCIRGEMEGRKDGR